ncbi:MAG: S1 family peptidase [Minisyncoccota bacterium]
MEKDNQQNHFNNPVVVILLIALVGLGGYFLLTKNSSTTPDPQQAEIDALKRTVEDLKNQKPQTVIKEVPAKTTSITDIVNEWGPVIPIVVCNFRNSNGTIVESSVGSAILRQRSGDHPYTILTNKHVVTNSIGNFANDCQIQFPNDSQIFTAPTAQIVLDPNGTDGAQIVILTPNDNIINLIARSKKKFCTSIPSVGDTVVILGYPAIGASSGITATEGIISGYDGDYYVTSAKIDHGNSGGAAIDLKNNCDLGIPTYVISGQLESLARILKAQALDAGNENKLISNSTL